MTPSGGTSPGILPEGQYHGDCRPRSFSSLVGLFRHALTSIVQETKDRMMLMLSHLILAQRRYATGRDALWQT